MSDGVRASSMAQSGTKSARAVAKASWRLYEADQAAGPVSQDLCVGIAASFTANGIVQFLGAHLLSFGFRPKIAIGPYNQLLQVCFEPKAHFGDSCNAVALLWRIEDLMGEDCIAFLNGDGSALTRALGKVASLVSAISGLRSTFTGTIVVGVPSFPHGMPTGLTSLDNPTMLGAFHRMIVGKFTENIASMEGIRFIDLDAIQRQVGYDQSFDPRQWYLYRQPYTDVYLYEVGILLGRIMAADRRSSKKCVVVDCDNTLWGGILGEDGLGGIEIGDEFPGSAYRDFQKLLLNWRQKGIFLAVASKNNEADVREVFDRHDAMVLKREHFSAWQVNWLPKAENIPLIAKALNIGVDSLVFIDDSPMEIAYMREAQPDVTSILLPEDPADIVSTLQRLTLFDRLDVTQEDRQRADMMRAERSREALSVKMSKGEFLRAIELRFDLFLVQGEDLGRVSQLINKTNQFNLTTRRYTPDEVRAMMDSSNHRVYGLSVADKFGEYGLTGVVIVEISANRKVWTIDTLLLSCRVLGRGVEASLLAALVSDAKADGIVELGASFILTKKNVLASTFLPDHGFKLDGDHRHLAVADAPVLSGFVKRIKGMQSDASRVV